MDLTKVGTEFTSKDGSFTVTKVTKGGGVFGLFTKEKIEVIFKNNKGVEKLVSYNKKDLENEFKKGSIKITHVEVKK